MDTEKQRQRRCDDTRLTKSRNARSTRGAYRVANQQRMAARRALEWIRTLKARLVFGYIRLFPIARYILNAFFFYSCLSFFFTSKKSKTCTPMQFVDRHQPIAFFQGLKSHEAIRTAH